MNYNKFSNVFLDLSNFFLHNSISFRPLIVCIEPTYLCNLKCKSCNLWKNFEKADSDGTILDESDYEALFKELKDMEIFRLVISGGEPFLRKDIIKIIECAKRQKLKLYITTNGTVLTKKIIKSLIDLHVDDILFSLDSPIADVHDTIRGKRDAFFDTTKAIEEIVKEKEKRGVVYPRILVNSVISKYNIENLEKIFDIFKNIGIDVFNFYYPTNVSKTSLEEASRFFGQKFYSGQFYNLNILPAKEELIKFLNILKEKKGGNVFIKIPVFSNSLFNRCIYPWVATTISPYGDVYPCTLTDKIKIGNVKKESLMNIWNSEGYRKLRKSLFNKKLRICNECTCGISIKDIIIRSLFFSR